MTFIGVCTKHKVVLEGDMILSQEGSTFDLDTSEMGCSPGTEEMLVDGDSNCSEYWEVCSVL